MTQKIYFDDGSILDITIVQPEKGTMAMIAFRKLNNFLDEELFDDPKLIPLAEAEVTVEEEDLSLDEEDLEDLDEFEEDDWEDEEEFDDDWLEEEEELDDEWVMNR